jgi:hypothetical protein
LYPILFIISSKFKTEHAVLIGLWKQLGYLVSPEEIPQAIPDIGFSRIARPPD